VITDNHGTTRERSPTSMLGVFVAGLLFGKPRPGGINALAASQLGFDGEDLLDALAIGHDTNGLYPFHPQTLLISS
jgi:hypothetical protein